VIDKVLNPGIVGVTGRRDAEFPAGVIPEQFAGPIGIIKWRISQDKIGFEVFVSVIEERTFVVPFDVGAVNTLNGKVEFGQAPGGLVGFLTVNRNQVGGVQISAVGFLL
jgi:hypothetical protein